MDMSFHAGPSALARLASPVQPREMVSRRWLRAPLIASVLALAACGESGPDLQAHFAADIPGHWEVSSFKVDVEEDVGTKVEPQRHYRFRAEVAPKADLFQGVGTLDGHTILKRVARSGDNAPVLGTARSAFHADQWETTFEHEQAPNFFVGKPADAYGAQHTVLGGSDYKRLMADARTALGKRAEQIAADEGRWQTMVGEWNAMNQKIQAENRQVTDALNQEQQRIRQEQAALRNQASQESRAADERMRALIDEKTAAPKQAFEARIAALDQAFRLQTAELQAQGKERQLAFNAERKKLRDAYNADVSAARKRMDAAEFTRYRANADEALRAGQTELETGLREHQAQLRQQATALSDQRREQAAQANTAYQEQIKGIREEAAAAQTATRNDISRKADAAIEALNTQWQKRRQEHQNAVRANNDQVTAKRREIDQLGARLQQDRNEGARQQQLLAQLEAADE